MKALNPHMIATNTLARDNGSINIQHVLTVSKNNGTVDGLWFQMEQDDIENPVKWVFTDETNRDDEYAAIVVDSNTFDAGTSLPFITPSLDTVTPGTASVIADPDGVNLDKVMKMSKTALSGQFQLTFSFKAIGMPKEVTWTFVLEASRDTVYGELTANVAAMTFLT